MIALKLLVCAIQIIVTSPNINIQIVKKLILKRHSKEDWSKSNIASPAWMGRYISWEKPTLKGAVDSAKRNIKMLNLF